MTYPGEKVFSTCKQVITALLFCCFFCQNAWGKIEIKVGGYYYPPFIETSSGKVSGITITMLEMLNQQQEQYLFTFHLTTAKNRYLDFIDNKYDVIFFENLAWGWQDFPLEISEPYLTGEEIYISLRKPGRSQKYFDNITNKSIASILGYHYRILDFNINERELTANYQIILSKSQRSNLNLLLDDRVDIVIINRSYLQQYFSQHPAVKAKLLISQKLDQRYTHNTLIRKNAPLTAKAFNQLLQALEDNGSLQRLWQQYGLESN